MQRLFARALVPMVVAALTACGGDAGEMSQAGDGPDTTATAAADDTRTAPGGQLTTAQGLVDPETASRDELTTIAGIDAALADSLVAARPFDDMTEVDAILAPRLDEGQRDEVYRRLWKPIDLNAASDEEILLIPGIGDRMLREFKEYRPYEAMAEFRREMGKYVDDEEVARMEQYVEVR